MDDGFSLRELLAKHQDGMAGASVLSLFFSTGYAILKTLSVIQALIAVVLGAVFSAALWFFLAEYLRLPVIWIVPLAFACGFGTFPLVRAYTRRDDALADKALDEAGRRLGGKP